MITRDQAVESDARWKSAIVGYGDEAPGQLMAHPNNWRIHTKTQKAALTQLLDKVGWVQNVIVNKRTGHVLDGHLRVGEAIARNEASVPVTYVDLGESDEALVLASLDPIGSLAATDEAALTGLLGMSDVEGELEALLRKTAGFDDTRVRPVTQEQIDRRQSELDGAFGGSSSAAAGKVIDCTCPECGNEFGVTAPE